MGVCTRVPARPPRRDPLTQHWVATPMLRRLATTALGSATALAGARRPMVPLALGASFVTASASSAAGSLHTFTGKTIAGSALSLSDLAGKPVLMLNVASR